MSTGWQNLSGDVLLNFTGFPITNNSTVDLSRPFNTSMVVPADGLTIVLTFSDDSVPLLPASGITGFSVEINGVARSVTAARTGNLEITLTPATPIYLNDQVLVFYTPGNVTDSASAHNPLASFVAVPADNDSTATFTASCALTLVSRSFYGATFSWIVTGPSTGAQLQRTFSGGTQWSDVAGGTSSPATDSLASENTAYDYRVRCTVSGGASFNSNKVAVSTRLRRTIALASGTTLLLMDISAA